MIVAFFARLGDAIAALGRIELAVGGAAVVILPVAVVAGFAFLLNVVPALGQWARQAATTAADEALALAVRIRFAPRTADGVETTGVRAFRIFETGFAVELEGAVDVVAVAAGRQHEQEGGEDD